MFTKEDFMKKFGNDFEEKANILNKPEKYLAYGTAGFRDKAEILDSTFFRMGMLAILRSISMNGNIVGLMVTASHNPAPDNGIKLVDPNGGMLSQAWEKYAIQLANAERNTIISTIEDICQMEKIDLLNNSQKGKIYVGRDTRESSEKLSNYAIQGANLMQGDVEDHGILTTPQLHHIVRMENGNKNSLYFTKSEWIGEEGYYKMFSDAFHALKEVKDTDDDTQSTTTNNNNNKKVIIDCAYGVGASSMLKMVKFIPETSASFTTINNIGEGDLNAGCGAEFVQKQRKPPAGVSLEKYGPQVIGEGGKGTTQKLVSFDGDADRIVYHYFDNKDQWHLLDGDAIAILCADFLGKEFKEIAHLLPDISLGIVQTAYANGGATQYLNSLQLTVAMAKTGVKFVHHKAEEYDIGIYFEANGHGTVIFSDKCMNGLLTLQSNSSSMTERQLLAVKRILLSRQLLNQAVGDAISVCLFVEAVLSIRGWGLENWDSLYSDLPSRQAKLPVRDRTVVNCNDSETAALQPDGLQEALNKAMSEHDMGRCFVRPSGTEDVIRIYAEAQTQKDADALALKAAHIVYDIVGGVGEKMTGF